MTDIGEPMPAGVIEGLRQIRSHAVAMEPTYSRDASSLLALVDSTIYLATLHRASNIVRAVADRHGVPAETLRKPGRDRETSHARQDAFLALRETLGWTNARIGAYFSMDGTTVRHGVKVALERRAQVDEPKEE